MELTQATELVQAMEARGDFKFKGIFALFNLILDWTAKFPINGILISFDQFGRELQLPADKLHEFMRELLGLGHSKARLVFAIPAVELLPTSEQGISHFLVYCRPLKSDGPTARRYVLSYIEKNQAILAKWIASHPPEPPAEFNEFLYKKIQQGRLPETHAGARIAGMIHNEMDTTAEQKKTTYTLFARPVIQKLINSKQLLLLKPPPDSPMPNYRGIYFSNPNELNERFKILTNFFRRVILNEPTTQPAEGEELEALLHKADSFDRTKFESLAVGHRQVILEFGFLGRVLKKIRREETEKETREKLENLVNELAKSGRLWDMDKIKMDERIRNSLMGMKSVLHSEYPLNGRLINFILHEKSIPPAIKAARDLFDNTENDSEVLILAAMGVEEMLDPDQKKAFQDLLQRVYFNRLPWYVKVLRLITGRSRLKPEEQEKIKREVTEKTIESKIKIRTAAARKEKKKLVSERLKGKNSVVAAEVKEQAALRAKATDEDIKRAVESEADVKAKLKRICDELNQAWDEKMLPNRAYLLERLPDFDESSLIFFLKKHGRKEVFSFRIKHDKPEYIWPILITRSYIKKNGRNMLNQAIKDSDEQRNASMPNQEKFDVSTAIEDFLTRLISKNRG